MPILTAGTNYAIRMDEVDFSEILDGELTMTPTEIRSTYPGTGNYIAFLGSFTFDENDDLSGGTLTGIVEYEDGILLYTISGLSIDALTFASWVENGEAILAKIVGLAGADQVTGSPFDDLLEGWGGNDAINGGLGADDLFGMDGNDALHGGDGDDILRGGVGDDLLNGGAGVDTADYSSAGDGVRVELLTTGGQNTGGGGTDTLDSIENTTGSAHNDQLIGSQADNHLIGGGGHDALIGLNGADTLEGGAGDDYIHNSDDHPDYITRSDGAVDTLSGGEGNDVIDAGAGDIADGGDGFDRLTVYAVSEATQGLVADFSNVASVQAALASLYGGTFTGFEAFGFSGTDFNDNIIGHDNADSDPLSSTLEGWGGNDVLDGRGGRDLIFGGDGDDRLDGGTGIDYLSGGQGGDWFYVDNAGDAVVELAGQGADRVIASATWAASATAEVETILTANAAGTEAIWLTGSDTANAVIGNAGDNRLFGQGGNDQLSGLDGADRLYGGLGVDVLGGGSGADILDGGAGADTLVGGLGDDFYYVDDQFDVIVEAAGQGTDRIFAGVSYVLAAGADVEQMSTLSAAGTEAIWLTGSNLANTITGNAGDNRLFGQGGNDQLSGLDGADRLYGGDGQDVLSGGVGNDILDGGTNADTLVGGAGDDFYYVDHPFDVIVEAAGQGNDRVFAAASFVLGAGADIEQISTTSAAGTAAINLTGSNLNNTITGNAGVNSLFGLDGTDSLAGLDGNDRLYGGGGTDVLQGGAGNDLIDGGTGNDTLIGGLGDDLYYVDSASDVVLETAGQGNDRVFASASYVLAAAADIETLSTTNAAATTAIDLTGNGLNNTVVGNAGANTLSGMAGNDSLLGMAGNDVYVFGVGGGIDTVTEGGGADVIEITGALTTSDLVWQVVGSDLYVGLVEAGNPGLPASQCADRIRIVGGASEGSAGYVETLTVGGQTVTISDVLASPQVPLAESKAAVEAAQVLPGLTGEDFLLSGKLADGGPQVQPDLSGEAFLLRSGGEAVHALFETAPGLMAAHGPDGALLRLDDAAFVHTPFQDLWGA
jgi:trimeric autotransporter adhesin